MKSRKEPTKMYLDVVGEIRSIIKEEGIQTGQRLPSERELVERLQVGRSTIREALRSLEIIGLIETRRGEGTYLADFSKHQFVEILADFIMQQPNSLLDVQETRRIHEIAAIKVLCQNPTFRALPVWESLLMKNAGEEGLLREDVMREVFVASENRLSLKIWLLLKQYSKVPFNEEAQEDECAFINQLLTSIRVGDESSALISYLNWINLIEGERGGINK